MRRMRREDPQLKLRLPQALKDKLMRAAALSNRSVNSEILSRLEGSFSASETLKLENVGEYFLTVISNLEKTTGAKVTISFGSEGASVDLKGDEGQLVTEFKPAAQSMKSKPKA